MNIPKYRAKKIDSEEYVFGYIREINNEAYFMDTLDDDVQIDPSTLAISFPDMLDSNNNPIFASLSESGKGGDKILKTKNSPYWDKEKIIKGIAIYLRKKFILSTDKSSLSVSGANEYPVDIKVMGIQP